VITTFNEERNLPGLLDSFIHQEKPFEVIIVDAGSRDRSQEIVRRYGERYPFIRLEIYPGTRGESRNRGIEIAKGGAVAFIDGDALANPFWLKELRKSLKKNDVVGGIVFNVGYQPFVELPRVEMFFRNNDLSLPSCNLVFKKKVLDDIGGFDPVFITAEDMDLNLRAVLAGYNIGYNEKAVVYHHERSTVQGFIKQAFWNGLGRRQLQLKHGDVGEGYDLDKLLSRKLNMWYFVRIGIGMLGYATLLLTGVKKYTPEKYSNKKTKKNNRNKGK